MSVRVCPVCDKQMKYAHFCTNCKAYIKEPVFWDKIYNLNGYGQQSTIVNQCENHDHRRENETGKVRSDYKKNVRTSASVERQKEQKRAEKMRQQNTEGQRTTRKKNTIFVILFIYIMIQVLLPMIAGIFSIFMRL